MSGESPQPEKAGVDVALPPSSSTSTSASASPSPTPVPSPTFLFKKLPDEIIEQILTATDPNGFASLVLLNRKWRSVSQRAHLYIHHLAQCPSFAASHASLPSADAKNLPALRRLFAREVKRNLFDAYLRPRETLVKLVSNSISSSSCPGGEGMHFSASPKSQHILAYNSSRIYVLDVRGRGVEVKREFKILRRPVAACIKDDGSLLAVLSSEMQVDLYDLQVSPPRRKQSILLDNSPRTIAMSPCGSVLAAAYEGGIEVSSLNPGALPSDRRSVKSDGVDTLAFSFDGTQILGSTTHSSPPNTLVLTAPYYEPGSHLPEESISAMWTTSILFPNSSRDCSHAVLIQDGSQEEALWTFAYDRSFETFRAVRIDDLRNGTTYFTGPTPKANSQAKLLPSVTPGASYHGDLVSAGFHGKEIWIYGVPADLDAVPDVSSNESGSSTAWRNSEQSGLSRNASSRGRDNNGGRVPQWQLLCDKLRNTFLAGTKVTEMTGVSSVKWLADFGDSANEERLIVTAKGVSGPILVTEEEDIDFIDGGRIALLDFDYRLTNGDKTEITIEVGTDEAEVLEEERRDMETEVAIVRRRTVARNRNTPSAMLRTATIAGRNLETPIPPVPALPKDDEDDDPLIPRRIRHTPARSGAPSVAVVPSDPEVASIEEQEAMDLPYAHASPRSVSTLRRAATAAAVSRTINPRTADGRPIEYRRADGRREHPHESDADNWVPPPPPYQKEDPGDMPVFMRGQSVAPLAAPLTAPLASAALAVPAVPAIPAAYATNRPRPGERSVTDPLNGIDAELHRSPSLAQRHQRQRTASDSTTMSRPRLDEDVPRPRSSPSVPMDAEDDLYDATPPVSPRQPAVQQHNASGSSDPSARVPVGSASNSTIPSSPMTVQTPREPHNVPSQEVSPASVRRSSQSSRGRIPSLDIQIPSLPQVQIPATSTQASPAVRRLSNAMTWPGVPVPPPTGNPSFDLVRPVAGHPVSAPVWHGVPPGFPPNMPPQPQQYHQHYHQQHRQPPPQHLQHLQYPQQQQHQRQLLHQPQPGPGYAMPAPGPAPASKIPSNLNPRRRSSAAIPPGPEARNTDSPVFQQPARPLTSLDQTSSWATDQDQPLIISTPTGVTGAFDPPNRRTSRRQNETPLVAPVPRHPRPTPLSIQRPTVERFETLYNPAAQSNSQSQSQSQSQTSKKRLLPGWRRSPSVSAAGGVSRQPSRAERSAAINMKEARKRGWDPSKSKKKKKKKKDFDVASSAAWTDISAVSAPKQQIKDKKCAVM